MWNYEEDPAYQHMDVGTHTNQHLGKDIQYVTINDGSISFRRCFPEATGNLRILLPDSISINKLTGLMQTGDQEYACVPRSFEREKPKPKF